MRNSDTIWCDGCGVEITWAPLKANQSDYCCRDCAGGYECGCGARMEEEDYPRGRGVGESGVAVSEDVYY